MDDRDRENLRFLLMSDPAAIKDWFDGATDDDHAYAMEILKEFADELLVKISLIDDREIDNYNEAASMLKKFTL